MQHTMNLLLSLVLSTSFTSPPAWAAGIQETSWRRPLEEAVFARSYSGSPSEAGDLAAKALDAAEASGDPAAVAEVRRLLFPSLQDEAERLEAVVGEMLTAIATESDRIVDLEDLGRPIDVARIVARCVGGDLVLLQGRRVKLTVDQAFGAMDEFDEEVRVTALREVFPEVRSALVRRRILESIDANPIDTPDLVEQARRDPDHVVRELAYGSFGTIDYDVLAGPPWRAKLIEGVHGRSYQALLLLVECCPGDAASELERAVRSDWILETYLARELQPDGAVGPERDRATVRILLRLLELVPSSADPDWAWRVLDSAAEHLSPLVERDAVPRDLGRSYFEALSALLDGDRGERDPRVSALQGVSWFGRIDDLDAHLVRWMDGGSRAQEAARLLARVTDRTEAPQLEQVLARAEELARLAVEGDAAAGSTAAVVARTLWSSIGDSPAVRGDRQRATRALERSDALPPATRPIAATRLRVALLDHSAADVRTRVRDELATALLDGTIAASGLREALAKRLVGLGAPKSAEIALSVSSLIQPRHDRDPLLELVRAAFTVDPEAGRRAALAAIDREDVRVPRTAIQVVTDEARWVPTGVFQPLLRFDSAMPPSPPMPVDGRIELQRQTKTVPLPSILCALPVDQRLRAASDLLSRSPDAQHAAHALEALLFGEVAEPALALLLERMDELRSEALKVRAIAAFGAALYDPARARIAEALEDPSPQVREAALQAASVFVQIEQARAALRPTGSAEDEGLRRLVDLTRAADTEVRLAAVRALGARRSALAQAALVELLTSKDEPLREAAAEALRAAPRTAADGNR